MPTTTFRSQRTGRVVSDAEVRALLDRRSPLPAASSGRKAFTDRLGLAVTATDAEFFAALDAKLAQRRPTSAPSPSAAEDRLYARVTNRAPQADVPAVDMSDEAIWARLHGRTGA